MAERELKRKTSTTRQQPEVDETDSTESVAHADELKAELDDLLDEIDDVLETNAEDFVKSYIQKGGQ